MDSLLELLQDTSCSRLALLQEELDTLRRDALSYPDDLLPTTKAKRYPAGLFSHPKLFEISCAILDQLKGLAKGDKPNDPYTTAAEKDPAEAKRRLYTSLRALELYEQFLLWQLDTRHVATSNRYSGLTEQHQQYLSNHRTKAQHFLDLREFLGHGTSFEDAWIADRSLAIATMHNAGDQCRDRSLYFRAVEKWASIKSFKQPPRLLPSPNEQDPWSTYVEFVYFHSLCQKKSGDRVIAMEVEMSREWVVLVRAKLLQPDDTALSLVRRLEVQEDLPEARGARLYEKFVSSWERLRQATEVADFQSASACWAEDMMDDFKHR
ncbi:unnamed protein product [Clonostachys solani]|uniref:Uncharacterized protein n=1 Tax=Clonostachys solani TaxID=160281 RepID=A0A9N9ZGJ3_9HYPO|nr:unnamed protein product [Clonostachys solani]